MNISRTEPKNSEFTLLSTKIQNLNSDQISVLNSELRQASDKLILSENIKEKKQLAYQIYSLRSSIDKLSKNIFVQVNTLGKQILFEATKNALLLKIIYHPEIKEYYKKLKQNRFNFKHMVR